MPRYDDIPQFTKMATYAVDHPWDMLQDTMKRYTEVYGLNMDPEFQRAHVWTEAQQIAYVEYILRGGVSGKDIYLNSPHWNMTRKPKTGYREFVVVDGKQRLHAVMRFLGDEIPAFGHKRSEYTDRLFGMLHARFRFHINDLKTEKEVLTWYLEFNTGGTIHTEAELNKVRVMLKKIEESA